MSLFRRRIMRSIRTEEKPVEEWELIKTADSLTASVTTSDIEFGEYINWELTQYRYVFDIELVSKADSETQLSVRDDNTQTKIFMSTGTKVGAVKSVDEIINSNRERRKRCFIAKYYNGAYSVKVTNFKLYKHT